MRSREESVLSLLGFAARARRLAIGTGAVCEALRKNSGIGAVVVPCDVSDNTGKRLSDRTDFYGVPLIRLAADGAALADAVGKRDGKIGAVGICEPHLAAEILRLMRAEH